MKHKSLPFLFCLLSLTLTPAFSENSQLLDLKNLAIPKSLGHVDMKFSGQDQTAAPSRRVINIQDIHAHLTAQQNIAAIVTLLNENYGIQTVGVEGGWSAASFPKSWGLPASSRGKQMLAQALLEQDYITGPTYSALFSKTPITLVGIEDPEIYQKNRALYLKHLNIRSVTLEKISIWEHTLQESKANIFNPDLLSFDKALTDFKDGKKPENFIPYALSLASAKNLKLEDLAQIQGFMNAIEVQKSMDPKKLEEEAGRIFETYKYAHLSVEELLKSGKVPEEKLDFYPEAKKYLELMRVQEQIPHRELFAQINEVIKRLKDKLLQTTEEKELDHRSQAIYAAKKIMTLTASSEDLKTYKLYSAPLATDLETQGLSEALEIGLNFYELAKKRDQIFFDQITQNPKLQGDIAVVTGGFHTEGLIEKLEDAGIAYTVITPDLGEKPEPADEKLYFTRLQENISGQTLSEKQNRDLTPGFDAGFSQASKTYDSGEHNIPKVVAIATSYQIGAQAPTVNSTAASSSENIFDISDAELKKNLIQTQNNIQKITAVVKLSDLTSHLNDPEKGAFNKTALLSFLANPKSMLLISNDDGEIDDDLLGKRNVKLVKKDVEKIVAQEKLKLTEKDSPLAVVGQDYPSSDSKVIPVKPYAGIFGAIRLILEDSRFSSADAVEKLMGRAIAVLQDIYNLKEASVSA